jgi:hypothetical protein
VDQRPTFGSPEQDDHRPPKLGEILPYAAAYPDLDEANLEPIAAPALVLPSPRPVSPCV